MAELPAKATKIPKEEVLQFVVEETSADSGEFRLKVADSALKPLVDYDRVNMTLSAGDTVETYVYKLGASTTVATLVVTYTDNTRQVFTSLLWT